MEDELISSSRQVNDFACVPRHTRLNKEKSCLTDQTGRTLSPPKLGNLNSMKVLIILASVFSVAPCEPAGLPTYGPRCVILL